MFDDYDNVDPLLVCDAASVLATTIAELQEYDQKVTIRANCSFVDELLRCFAQDWRCPLFAEYISSMADAPEFPSAYTGVWMGMNVMTPFTKIVHDVVTEINAPSSLNQTCGTSNDCGDMDKYRCIRGVCLESTKTWYWEALSPAFYKDGSYWKVVDDPSLPVFAESVWINIGMKLFPMVSPVTDVMTAAIGVLVTIISSTICYFGGRLFSSARVV
jgi:hypothetical protein